MTNQLGYTYNANKKSPQPFASLLFTGLNGRTFVRLEGMSNAAYKRWKDTEWWHESYERLWKGTQGEGATPVAAEAKSNTLLDQTTNSDEQKPSQAEVPQMASQDSVVYLTADSSDELTELKEGETYIIGGICDHNRYKVSLATSCRSAYTHVQRRTYALTRPKSLRYVPHVSQ